MSRETFTIETVETRPIEHGKRAGQTFKRAKLSGVGYVSVFANGDCDFLEENVGQMASAEVKVDNEEKGWKSASAFAKVEGQSAPARPQEAAGGAAMSDADWDAKEDRQRVGILYSVHLKLLFEYYVAHPEDPEALTISSYKDLVSRARRHAVADLGWIRGYAASEVPF